VDTISRKRRSENMRRIKSKGTKPELVVRRFVHSLGYRFRLHAATLPGKPDIVLSKLKRIIEVRGCFWHRHGSCIDSHIPSSRIEYWRPKLRRNVKRDKQNLALLQKLGWRVLVLWECEVMASGSRSFKTKVRQFLRRSSV
jgi:DNA mismatch endonuclease, patch repair protein